MHEFNFSLNGLTGFDFHGKTVGVIGTDITSCIAASNAIRAELQKACWQASPQFRGQLADLRGAPPPENQSFGIKNVINVDNILSAVEWENLRSNLCSNGTGLRF